MNPNTQHSPFHWSSLRDPGTGKVQGYLVFSAHKYGPHPDDRVCLGAIKRSSRRGWLAQAYGAHTFLESYVGGSHDTRERASIALVGYLNTTKYGRERLKRAQLHVLPH